MEKAWEMAMGCWGFLKSDQGAALLLGLLAMSEALGGSNRIKQNSLYQLSVGALKKLKSMLPEKKM